MNHAIFQPVQQGRDGEQDAENNRIAATADKHERLCAIHEAQRGDSLKDVSRFETEQRAAEQMAKSQGYWIPMMDWHVAQNHDAQYPFSRYRLFLLWLCRV